MDIAQMTRKDFEALPDRGGYSEDVGEFSSLVIMPARTSRDLHDSGYRLMDYVAVRNGEPIVRLSGGSDVLHLDGIGGFGPNWVERYGKVPDAIPTSAWSIDCLPKSGLLHIWPGSGRMVCGVSLSSFEIYALPKIRKDDSTIDSA